MKILPQHRRDIVEICKRIHARGWIAAADGNVSIRLGRDRLLTTPSGLHKGYITERDLVICDLEGQRVSGQHRPSSEIAMHLAAYQERADVRAVVHAHPTYCIAFSLAGVTLAQCLLPEIVFTFGSIPTTEYCAPTTQEVPREIRKLIGDHDAMILDRHGSVTVGADVFEAFDKLERMEHIAQITHAAHQLGDVRPLTRPQVEQLVQIGADLGLPRRKVTMPCERCNACPHGELPRRSPGAPMWPPTGPPPAARTLFFPGGRGAAPAGGGRGLDGGRMGSGAGGCGSGAGGAPLDEERGGPLTAGVAARPDRGVLRIIAEEVARELQGRPPWGRS